jgi:hypothetical protein
MAVQVPRKVADLIRPDAPAAEARDALELGDIATHDADEFALAGAEGIPDPLTVATVQGSTASGGNLTLRSTSHATKGTVTVDSNLACGVAGNLLFFLANRGITFSSDGMTFDSSRMISGGSSGTNLELTWYNGSVLFVHIGDVPGYDVRLFYGLAAADHVYTGYRAKAHTPGAPAAGFGARFQVQASSSTTNYRDVGDVRGTWADPTDATRKGRMSLVVADASGTDKVGLSVSSNGTTADVVIPIANVRDALDDAAAAALSPPCPIGGLYRTASVLKIRVT